MPQYYYTRAAVPVGQEIDLDVQFSDSAGNNQDTDAYPTIRIEDAVDAPVRAASSTDVQRLGTGLYRLTFTVPDGFSSGSWNDEWFGSVDGYTVGATFSFFVSSVGSLEAVDTTVVPTLVLGDDPDITYTQDEIKGINVLLKGLKSRLRNTAIKPDGTPCPVVPDAELIDYLRLALSEFNLYAPVTYFLFSEPLIYGTFSDLIIEGAVLQTLSILAVLSAGQEFTIVDNGSSVQPPNISGAINNMITARQSLYLEKLKNLKHAGMRPSPRGMGAGRIVVNNTVAAKLRHVKEGQIL